MQYLDINTSFADEISKKEVLNREFAAAMDSKDYFKAHELLKQGANCTKSHIIEFIKTYDYLNHDSLETINKMVSSLSNQGVYDTSLGFYLISLILKNEFVKPLGKVILGTLTFPLKILSESYLFELVKHYAFKPIKFYNVILHAVSTTSTKLAVDGDKAELVKSLVEENPSLISYLSDQVINHLDKNSYKYLSEFYHLNPTNISYNILEDAGYFSPIANKKNELVLMLYGDDHNHAFTNSRELPSKFLKQGYDVIVSHIEGELPLRKIHDALQLTNSKISEIFLFVHGGELNNQHHFKYDTLEFLTELRKVLLNNTFDLKGISLTVDSCYSGSLNFINLKTEFPEINKLYLSDTLNAPSWNVDFAVPNLVCDKLEGNSKTTPIESFVSCTSDFDKIHRDKSFVDLNSKNVKEFIEHNANKQLSQYEKTCFHRIHSEAPFKYSDELVNECKNYFETLEA